MGLGFASLPDAPRWRLTGARVASTLLPKAVAGPGDWTDVEIVVHDGRIAGVARPGGLPFDAAPTLHLAGGIVFPAFVELHTHLDKGHIWPRTPNPDGTFPGALGATARDREGFWSAEDVRARMEFSLRCAYAHGTAAIRTHLDSIGPQIAVSWRVFDEVRAAWADRITLQAVSLYGIESARDPAFLDEVTAATRRNGGVLGGVTYMVPDVADLIEAVFRRALDADLALDFHVDESSDPGARSLEILADTALRLGFERPITVGHCCSLALQDDATIDRVTDKLAAARIGVVSLPMCNMYLQDRRAGRTPRWRGVTLLHELKAKGVAVSVSSDNTRDPFYAYGDLDALEVYREATRILQLDHPVGDWPRVVTATPADAMGLTAAGRIAVGAPADLVLTRARETTELLARPQADRTVVRAGRAIDTTLPAYAELDAVVGRPQT